MILCQSGMNQVPITFVMEHLRAYDFSRGAESGAIDAFRNCSRRFACRTWNANDHAGSAISPLVPTSAGGANAGACQNPISTRPNCIYQAGSRRSPHDDSGRIEGALRAMRGLQAGARGIGHARSSQNAGGIP